MSRKGERMAELLKNRYNFERIHELAITIQGVYPAFQVDDFIKGVMDETWEDLPLKARMRQITVNLGKHLPAEYEEALSILDRVIESYPEGFSDFTLMYLPDFVEVYGQDEKDWELSMKALEKYTVFSSSEFAVRPFIIQHEQRMMKQMSRWATHDDPHVRRLASEGCRPQLPWGQALVSFKKDPSLVIDILEQLKSDPSLYVRKSVANNLNDISKTHPERVIELAKKWFGKNKWTNWVVKHGCRTLLKKGNHEILALFGFVDGDRVIIEEFTLETNSLSIGEAIVFSFGIEVNEPTKIRLEYALDFVKANGKRNRKIFQISEISLEANSKRRYIKAYTFKDLSTRKHYPGTHSITLIVNGVERERADFDVTAVE